jgi:hypothetical protein
MCVGVCIACVLECALHVCWSVHCMCVGVCIVCVLECALYMYVCVGVCIARGKHPLARVKVVAV